MLVVLAHGLFGFGAAELPTPFGIQHFEYFHGIAPLLARRGHQVIAPGVNPVGSIAGRAEQLREKINAAVGGSLPDKGAVIIAHSMGGLDARYLMSPAGLGMGRAFTALVTIATPHRGSPIADLAQDASAHFIANHLLQDVAGLDTMAISNLTTSYCATFDAQTIDDPSIAYYSVSTACPSNQVPAIFFATYPLVQERAGANDGVVPVASSTHGTVLNPPWPVDHLRAVNMPLLDDLVRSPADVLPRYEALFDRLERDRVLLR